jgi:hypothetical protein
VGDLWAALLGAIVGGLLALAGSVLVNRWELRRTARLRMYEELLPKVENETWPRLKWGHAGTVEFIQSLDALQRASVIAGLNEFLETTWLMVNAQKYVTLVEKGRTPAEAQQLAQELKSRAAHLDDILNNLDLLLAKHISRSWPGMWQRRWRQRLRQLRRKGLRKP